MCTITSYRLSKNRLHLLIQNTMESGLYTVEAERLAGNPFTDEEVAQIVSKYVPIHCTPGTSFLGGITN